MTQQFSRRTTRLSARSILKHGKTAVIVTAELKTVVIYEFVALHRRSVNERAVLAPEVEQIVFSAHLHDLRVVA